MASNQWIVRTPSKTGQKIERWYYSPHQHVAELPGVCRIDVFRKQPGPARQRRPVGVGSDHRAEVGPLDFAAAAEIHFVGLHNSALGIFHPPHLSLPHSPPPLTPL